MKTTPTEPSNGEKLKEFIYEKFQHELSNSYLVFIMLYALTLLLIKKTSIAQFAIR
jgi:hypothetical protein